MTAPITVTIPITQCQLSESVKVTVNFSSRLRTKGDQDQTHIILPPSSEACAYSDPATVPNSGRCLIFPRWPVNQHCYMLFSMLSVAAAATLPSREHLVVLVSTIRVYPYHPYLESSSGASTTHASLVVDKMVTLFRISNLKPSSNKLSGSMIPALVSTYPCFRASYPRAN